jgi:glutathione S-transferase
MVQSAPQFLQGPHVAGPDRAPIMWARTAQNSANPLPHSMMKLIGSTASPFVRKVRIFTAEKRIEYELEVDNVWAADAKVPAVNPLGKVPALLLDDGSALFDSRVIVEFLDTVSPIGKLIPSDSRDRIEVKRWEALADGILDAAVLARLENSRKAGEKSQAWADRQMGKVSRGLEAMNRQLGDKPWCAGNAFSLADIAVGTCLAWLDFRFATLGWKDDHPNLARHLAKLAERPSFVETAPKE